MSKIALGTGLGHGTDLAWLSGDTAPPPPPFEASLSVSQGSVSVVAGATTVSLTLSGHPQFDGTYVVSIADLLAGPVNLVLPEISGQAITGSDLTRIPGLWAYEGTGPAPGVSTRWVRDGAPIPEETGASYTVEATDEGTHLSVEEEVTDTHGTRTAESATLIAVPPLELTLSEGTVEIVAGVTALDIIISGTAEFDGTYTVDLIDLAAGPINLVRPALIGVGEVGEVLNVRPGLWAYEDNGAAPGFEYGWWRDATQLSGQTAQSYTVDAADTGHALSVIETATDAQGSRLAQSGAVSISAPAPTLSVARVGGFQSSGTPIGTPSFTLDLSGYGSGDQIVVFYGPSVYAATSTLDGMAGTKISTDGANSGASRMAAFAHTLSGAGSATATLDIGLPSSTNHHVISVHAIQGGQISDVVAVRNTTGAPQSVTVTPTHANNVILACAMGVSFMDAVFTWAGVTELETANMPTASSRNISIGQESNVALAPHTVTGTPSGTSHTGLIAIAISEA